MKGKPTPCILEGRNVRVTLLSRWKEYQDLFKIPTEINRTRPGVRVTPQLIRPFSLPFTISGFDSNTRSYVYPLVGVELVCLTLIPSFV